MTLYAGLSYRLPPEVERGAEGGSEFMTEVLEAVAGIEQRNRRWAKPRHRYNVGYAVLNSADVTGTYRAVRAMHMAHFGKLYPFRFKDWGDYVALNDSFGTGNGVQTQYQLGKFYDPGLMLIAVHDLTKRELYFREIYLLATAPVIRVNNVTLTVTTDYSIGETGLVTFVSPPGNSHSIVWDGQFDVPVRFDVDYLPSILTEVHLAQYDGIQLREVLGVDELVAS